MGAEGPFTPPRRCRPGHCGTRRNGPRRKRPTGEAATEDSLGYIEHHSGHHERAIAHYQRALTLLRDLGNTYETPGVLESCGDPHLAVGDVDQARKIWREALRLFREQGRSDDVRRVQRRLDDL